MRKVIKPHFTLEFKRDAAHLVIAKDYSIRKAAENLGVSESALKKWVKQRTK